MFFELLRDCNAILFIKSLLQFAQGLNVAVCRVCVGVSFLCRVNQSLQLVCAERRAGFAVFSLGGLSGAFSGLSGAFSGLGGAFGGVSGAFGGRSVAFLRVGWGFNRIRLAVTHGRF
ncbi:MAG: hypothetical protein LUH82_06555, partial [Clostridiales bacterium]|nr:hypothetical protein [Clostridiales bacterium]